MSEAFPRRGLETGGVKRLGSRKVHSAESWGCFLFSIWCVWSFLVQSAGVLPHAAPARSRWAPGGKNYTCVAAPGPPPPRALGAAGMLGNRDQSLRGCTSLCTTSHGIAPRGGFHRYEPVFYGESPLPGAKQANLVLFLTPNHRSSPPIATDVGSALQKVLPPLQPAHD